MPDLFDLVSSHSGQVRNFYLLVLRQDTNVCRKLIPFCISLCIKEKIEKKKPFENKIS